jgi:hypothetical protein
MKTLGIHYCACSNISSVFSVKKRYENSTLCLHNFCFADQTPTPTKFLKNCEELGLFSELSKNPFDYSFKKAMDDPMEHVSYKIYYCS